jgi:hypothetical protein
MNQELLKYVISNKPKKLKLSRYTSRRCLGERRYSSYSFSTSALDGGEWSASRPGRALAPRKGPPSTHCTGGWVGLRAGLDTEARRKILLPLPGIKPRSPCRPARSQTLYWLSYPAHQVISLYRDIYNEHGCQILVWDSNSSVRKNFRRNYIITSDVKNPSLIYHRIIIPDRKYSVPMELWYTFSCSIRTAKLMFIKLGCLPSLSTVE